jgi:hypothetical protein
LIFMLLSPFLCWSFAVSRADSVFRVRAWKGTLARSCFVKIL